MGFDSNVNFFKKLVPQRIVQLMPIKGHPRPSVLHLEYSLKVTPYYHVSYHKKALLHPLYHAANLVYDLAALIAGIALTFASLYADRDETLSLAGLSFLQLGVVLSDCLLALISVATFISRTCASVKNGYTENTCTTQDNSDCSTQQHQAHAERMLDQYTTDYAMPSPR